ncbi:MAG TPA: hypothetical protein VFW34_08865 [Candidatus Rubrimentiphilum sp.]|nr:hypothetical protein [Candidatus Rubrimentiphilum sp.]
MNGAHYDSEPGGIFGPAISFKAIRLWLSLLVLVAALLASSQGCANNGKSPVPPTGKILGWELNPKNNTAVALTFQLYGKNKFPDGVFDVASGNEHSYWDIANTTSTADGDRVRIVARSKTFLPYVGDRIWIYEESSKANSPLFIASALIEGAKEVINPNFVEWRAGYPAPTGWTRVGNLSPIIKQVQAQGRIGIEITAEQSPARAPVQVALEQLLPLSNRKLSFDILPSADCSVSSLPTLLIGVQIADDQGRALTYCVSSKVISRKIIAMQDTENVLIVLPGRIHSWNHLETKISDAQSLLDLKSNDFGMLHAKAIVLLNPSANGSAPVIPSVSAVFSGFKLSP